MRTKKMIVTVSAIAAVISVMGFSVNGIKLSELIKQTKSEMKTQEQEMAKQEEKLQELQRELENINSPEYIKKVAEEQLGMVEEDTIVFRKKNK